MLAAGGNAVDAAVATAYALAVTHPSAGNLGGGGFMLIARVGEPVVALDFRERAPFGITLERFDAMLKKGPFGPAASAVPGSVAGLNAAHRRFGRLELREAMAPALRLAREGHVVGAREALTLGWNWARLARDPEALRSFGVKGRPVRAGASLVRSDLARTLERIAKDGDAGFYSGPTAIAIARAMADTGLISLTDLQAYRAVERRALSFGYRGYEVATMPPPSSGGVAVRQMLLALDRLGAHTLEAGSAAELHLLLEVAKRAQALRRTELIDPDSDPEAMAPGRLLARFSPERLLEATAPIDASRATPARDVSPLYDLLAQEPDHTTHFAVVDAEGHAVSCTTTLSSGFGAGYVVPGTGIVMNNSLAAFSRAGLNLPASGRRMLSSMSPTVVSMDGRPVAVLGSPGGDTIPSTLVQIARHLLDHQMSIEQAVEAPRIHHGFVPDVVRYERQRPWPADVLQELARRGHSLEAKGAPIGDAKNILVVDGVAHGHADTREGGLAAGPDEAAEPSRTP